MEFPFWVEIFKAFGPPVIVGVVAAYVTVQSTLSSLEERVSDNEQAIEALKEGQEAIKKDMNGIHRLLTELNVKMGLLLKGKLDVGGGDEAMETLSEFMDSNDG